MKGIKTKKIWLYRKIVSLILAIAMVVGSILLPTTGIRTVLAADTAINSMTYFSAGDGPVITKSGVGSASYGFVMPIFNGGNSTWENVSTDLAVLVKVNGNWINIDNSSFVYNQNWGNWSDGGFNGYWFTVSETTYLRLASKTTGVTLDYTLVFTNIPKTTITSMTVTQGPLITAGVTGSVGFTYPIFNGNSSIPYAAVAEDLKVYVKAVSSNEWIDIDNNAASGWIYDRNFGQFTDGGGGYWFTVDESINVKLESKTSHVSLIYTITYNEPVRNTYNLTPYDDTNFVAGETGAIGIPLPKIDGSAAVQSELGNFVYEIKVNGVWVELGDVSKSSFSYSGNGYNNLSDANQWGYWADYIYGLWFQPIQVDMELRIGYPLNGQAGGSIGNNCVYYTFIGNPNAPRPDVSDLGNVEIGTTDNANIEGMNLIWQDEFNGTSLDTSVWNYNTGYYINDDPNSWGWGNNEMEHYTDSERNIYLADGKLNITAYEEPKSFPQDPNRFAMYSSGKITTKDNFTMKYGRVDIRAKLPSGNGVWPALWMLPNEDTYGAWAASGEIDIMEAKGRLPGITSGALHFGGQWPVNRYISGEYVFQNGQTFESDFHVYTLIWEEDNLKWYVDGKCFLKITREQWYSVSAPNNINAPFDQEFYLIMNLAIGGHFDGGLLPDASDIPATMQVDYVRAYKPSGENPVNVPVTGVSLNVTSTDVKVGQTTQLNATILPTTATNKNITWSVENESIATVDQTGKITGIATGTTIITVKTQDGNKIANCTVTVKAGQSTVIIGDEVRGLKKTGNDIEFYVKNATFADLHYKLNNGGQINVAMISDGNRNYTYSLKNLNYGDKVEYFFTYNPGQGALDTQTFTYIHRVTQGTEVDPENPSLVVDVAMGKLVSSSGAENDTLAASNLTDNNVNTRWSSNFSDDAWFVIDLGSNYTIKQFVLNWEAAFGKQYDILVSVNGVDYTNVLHQTNGVGGIETFDINVVNARYVKLQGIERALPYGYSLWDVKVMGY